MVFDLDGVLVDTSEVHAQAYAEVWRRAGLVGPSYADIAGRRTEEVVREVLADSTEQERAIWVEFKQTRARQLLETAPVRFAGALRVLSELAATNVPLGLATGASRLNVELLLARQGLARFFKSVVTADEVTRGKPHPMPFEQVTRELGVAVEQTLVVEDSGAGMRAAVAAGAAVVCVHTGLAITHPRFCGSFGTLDAVGGWILERLAGSEPEG